MTSRASPGGGLLQRTGALLGSSFQPHVRAWNWYPDFWHHARNWRFQFRYLSLWIFGFYFPLFCYRWNSHGTRPSATTRQFFHALEDDPDLLEKAAVWNKEAQTWRKQRLQYWHWLDPIHPNKFVHLGYNASSVAWENAKSAQELRPFAGWGKEPARWDTYLSPEEKAKRAHMVVKKDHGHGHGDDHH